MSDDKINYLLPNPISYLRVVQESILTALTKGEDIKIVMPPIVTRAYTLVNPSGVIAIKNREE